MSYKVTYDFGAIDAALGIVHDGPHLVDDEFVKENCWAFNRPDGKITRQYWANLTEDERRDRLENHGMSGKKHTEETRMKMRQANLGSKRPTLYKGGTLVKDGVVVSFTCLSHFCKENKLSSGHVCELLKGKRKSVKGWKLWAP